MGEPDHSCLVAKWLLKREMESEATAAFDRYGSPPYAASPYNSGGLPCR